MNEQKGFFTKLGELIDARHGGQRHALIQDTQSQPGRLRRILRWLTPNGGTLLLVAALIVTAQVWAKPLTGPASAPGPSATTVNYQGRLADSGGAPLDGSYGMTFALYDAATDGSLVWGPESHAAVPVSGGLFSVGLGSQTSGGIPTTTWGGDRYLEIAVGGETLSPRELIRSVPIAGMALTVPDGSITGDQIADGAVTLDKLGLEKYPFGGSLSDDDRDTVWYIGPTGVKTVLDLTSCTTEGWCCNAENTICYYHKSGEDSMLEFSLQGAPSRTCLLLHDEDDRPKKLYYATDGGNDCQLGEVCVRLRHEGATGNPIRWGGYDWLCGW